MDNVIVGIKEDELKSLSVEILNCADHMAEIFDKFDVCIEHLPACYSGASCTNLIERYRDLAASYATIKNNITSYSDDLIALLHKMHSTDQDMGKLFLEYSDDRERKTKQTDIDQIRQQVNHKEVNNGA